MYGNEMLQKWIEEHNGEDYCDYCIWNDECGGSGVRCGPNGPTYPLCTDRDISEYLDEDMLMEDINEVKQ